MLSLKWSSCIDVVDLVCPLFLSIILCEYLTIYHHESLQLRRRNMNFGRGIQIQLSQFSKMITCYGKSVAYGMEFWPLKLFGVG